MENRIAAFQCFFFWYFPFCGNKNMYAAGPNIPGLKATYRQRTFESQPRCCVLRSPSRCGPCALWPYLCVSLLWKEAEGALTACTISDDDDDGGDDDDYDDDGHYFFSTVI